LALSYFWAPGPVQTIQRSENYLPYRDSNFDPSVVQSAASRYTDYQSRPCLQSDVPVFLTLLIVSPILNVLFLKTRRFGSWTCFRLHVREGKLSSGCTVDGWPLE
jgi:hypothetical protein